MKRFLIILPLLLLLVSCKPKEDDLIEAPSNINNTDSVLTWNAVDDADYYKVMIDDTEFTVSTNSFSLLDFNNGLYDVSICSYNGNNDSNCSTSLTIEINRVYDLPTNLAYENNEFTWTSTENATGYTLSINGTHYDTTTTSYAFTPSENMEYVITVKSIYDNQSSEWTESIYFHTFSEQYTSYETSFNILHGGSLKLVIDDAETVNSLYLDGTHIDDTDLEIDGMNVTVNGTLLTSLEVGEHTIDVLANINDSGTLIDSLIKITLTITDDDTPTIISSNSVVYNNKDVVFKFYFNDATITNLDGSDITSEDYLINGDTLTIYHEFIDSILMENPDRVSLILSYSLQSDDEIIVGYLFIYMEEQ